MRKFELYEFLGYISPGILFLVSLGYIWPTKISELVSKDVTIGGVAIGLIFAYAAGQLLQAIGNLIENIVWKCSGGKPTDWLRTKKHNLIDSKQLPNVEECVKKMLPDDTFKLDESIDEKGWYSITRQIYAFVADRGQTKRIDTFNANYGLCRGLASALLVLLFINLVCNFKGWQIHIILSVLCGLAIYRFCRFGVIYARELFVQFLQSYESKGLEH